MKKDFKTWHKKKECIHEKTQRVYFHEREIWWCSVGVNIGFEQDGKGERFARPVIIFKKFNKEVFWAIPLSTKIKRNRFYVSFLADDEIERVAIISQLRLIDAKRLLDKLGVVREKDYGKIQKAIINLCSS